MIEKMIISYGGKCSEEKIQNQPGKHDTGRLSFG